MVKPCTCPPPTCCRRCGQCVIDNRLVVYVAAENGTEGERIDMCQDCASLFTMWFLRKPNATAPLRGRGTRAGRDPARLVR